MKYFDYTNFIEDNFEYFEEKINRVFGKSKDYQTTDKEYRESAYYTILSEGMHLDKDRLKELEEGKDLELSRP